MKLKQKPEDFSVKESFRFDEVAGGKFRVYMMDKQKVSTFEAINRIREKFGLKPGAISFCGLKDKQGRTEQLIAVDGFDVDMQEPDLRLKFLGLTDHALSAANITSNRFSVTVRAVRESELPQINLSAAEVNRLGVVNYFDDQRFGSLKHGQGYIAKDLLRGDFEAALRNFMAVPSELDRTDDAKVKKFWSENWGDWTARCPWEGNKKYARILKSLREKPKDFVSAFLQIDSSYRAMQLFTYQSYIWNEGARRLLQLLMPREHLFPMQYQAGTVLHHRDATPEVLQKLRGLTFPLLAPDTVFHDEQVREAAMWALGKEHLTLEQLRVEAAPKLLYLKHEERPLLVYPHKLVVGRPMFDELNKPFLKVNVAFTLPPGSYATLVVKRLFHFAPSESDLEYLAERKAFREGRGRDEEDGEDGEGKDGPERPRWRDERGERAGFKSYSERGDRSGGRRPGDRAGGFKARDDRGGSSAGGGFKSRDDRGGSSGGGGGFKSRDDRGGSSTGGGFKARDDRGGGSRPSFKSRDDRGGSAGGGRGTSKPGGRFSKGTSQRFSKPIDHPRPMAPSAFPETTDRDTGEAGGDQGFSKPAYPPRREGGSGRPYSKPTGRGGFRTDRPKYGSDRSARSDAPSGERGTSSEAGRRFSDSNRSQRPKSFTRSKPSKFRPK